MKKLIALFVLLSLAACQKDADVTSSQISDREVTFSAESISPLTKVSGTEWEMSDAVGITATNRTEEYDNIKYTAEEGGATVSFTPDSKAISYPAEGSELSFHAYYPYKEGWSYESGSLIIELSGQDGSQKAQSKVDLLESYAYNKVEGDEVKFQFTHSLSKVQITVSNYTDETSLFSDLSDLSASIYTQRTSYDVYSDEVVESAVTQSLGMVESSNDGKTAIFTAVIAPGAVSDNVIFTDGTSYYTAALTIESAEAGKQYNFSATVGEPDLTSDGVVDLDGMTDEDLKAELEIVGDIYQISTARELKIFAELVNRGYSSINGALLNDIKLSAEWTPIGTGEYDDTAYAGVFDGGGYSVTGLYVVASTAYQGLFGSVVNGTVKNLSVGGSVIVSDLGTCGVVAGYCKHATLISCTALKGSSVSGNKNNVGGISGYAYNTTFTDCHNNASASGTYYVGGIVGWCNGAYLVSFTNCSNTGAISSSGDSIGGIAGKMFGSNTVVHTMTNCFNSGKISGGKQHVGGLVGANQGGAIYNSYNVGEVYGASTNVGGLVGVIESNTSDEIVTYATMENCYSSAKVTGGSNVGLVAGICNGATITLCYYNNSQSGEEIGLNNDDQIVVGYSTSVMQDSDFALLLNNNAYELYWRGVETCAWTAVSGSYPTLDFDGFPTYTDPNYIDAALGSRAESNGNND